MILDWKGNMERRIKYTKKHNKEEENTSSTIKTRPRENNQKKSHNDSLHSSDTESIEDQTETRNENSLDETNEHNITESTGI